MVSNFASLSAGDYKSLIAQMSPDVHHVFAGDTSLGGERHTRDSVERWFERLVTLFPKMHFEVGRIISSGPPWDIWIAVTWDAQITPAAGDPYINQGSHFFRIRKGRVSFFHAFEDSQKVARACERMAAAGIEEATAPQIVD